MGPPFVLGPLEGYAPLADDHRVMQIVAFHKSCVSDCAAEITVDVDGEKVVEVPKSGKCVNDE